MRSVLCYRDVSDVYIGRSRTRHPAIRRFHPNRCASAFDTRARKSADASQSLSPSSANSGVPDSHQADIHPADTINESERELAEFSQLHIVETMKSVEAIRALGALA